VVLDFLLIFTLIYIGVNDWREFRIPNAALFILFVLAFFKEIRSEQIVYAFFVFVVLFSLFYSLEFFFEKNLMGGGDIKFIALLPLYLDLVNALFVVWFSAVLALIFAKIFRFHLKKIPYGTYLALAFGIVYFSVLNFTVFINFFLL
jgi:leader peptidase (prepilin peptidase)/N-methyltransferase